MAFPVLWLRLHRVLFEFLLWGWGFTEGRRPSLAVLIQLHRNFIMTSPATANRNGKENQPGPIKRNNSHD